MLTQYLESILRPLLSEPNALFITEGQDEQGILLTVRVSKYDMGRVIGREGRTAIALRVLLRLYGSLNKAAVAMKIEEPEGGKMYKRNDLDTAIDTFTSKTEIRA